MQHRFRVTGTGKIMRTKIGKSHLRRNKPKRTLRVYSQSLELDPVDMKRMKKVFTKGLK